MKIWISLAVFIFDMICALWNYRPTFGLIWNYGSDSDDDVVKKDFLDQEGDGIKSLIDEIDNIESTSFELEFVGPENYINWYKLIDAVPDIYVYGQILNSYFFLHVLVAGLILLLVLTGVVYLTNSYKPNTIEQAPFKQLSRRNKK